VLPSLGNIVYELKVHQKNIIFFPAMKLSEFQRKPMQTGIPFLAPWANRLDSDGFWANGKRYNFNAALGNYRKDGRGLPIHGLLGASMPWRVTGMGADKVSAYVTSRLEYWRQPDLMAQWPFAHEYEMTYRLSEGALEVKTAVANLSSEAMPLGIGFHPYYRIPDVARDQWVLRNPARKAIVTDDRLIPTGEFKAVELPNPIPLKGRTLDDGFTDLERDARGMARFSIEAEDKKIEILFGPKFPVAVIWQPALPPGQASGFICVEPMTGPTNAINLNHAGKYGELQTIPAGGKWIESFWIRATGF
jgi:aldose 1-epimerase